VLASRQQCRSAVCNVRPWWRARQPQVPHARRVLKAVDGRSEASTLLLNTAWPPLACRCICVVVDGEAVGLVPTYRLLVQALLFHHFPLPLRALLPVAMAAGRRHARITASQEWTVFPIPTGWTVFDLPSTPRCLESVRSATCG